MLCWMQFGDLHVEETDGWESLRLFERIVEDANRHLAGAVDVAVLPGDNANHGTDEQFEKIAVVASRLTMPLQVLPGDHDFEPGTLHAFNRILAPSGLPHAQTIGGVRCLFLDIVSAGSGGPDFRLGVKQTSWLSRELISAGGNNQPVVVFMHAYPEDLFQDSELVGRLMADHGVRFVGTGHTHYNELLNDGRVVYAATRSTGQIEEGAAGFSLGALDGGAVSWRFKELDTPWPFVLITSPAHHRLVTDPRDRVQVPEARMTVRAKVFGTSVSEVTASLDESRAVALAQQDDGVWQSDVETVDDGLHRLSVTAKSADGTHDTDRIEVLVRSATERPKRGGLVAPGRIVHAIGAWPEHGILGSQLGPNRNGLKW